MIVCREERDTGRHRVNSLVRTAGLQKPQTMMLDFDRSFSTPVVPHCGPLEEMHTLRDVFHTLAETLPEAYRNQEHWQSAVALLHSAIRSSVRKDVEALRLQL